MELPDIPLTMEDRECTEEYLVVGFKEGFHHDILGKITHRSILGGVVIFSVFTIFKDDCGGKNFWFIVNFSRHSKHCKRGSIGM